MPSRHLLDPELQPLAELMPGGGLTAEMLAQLRQVMVEQTKANAVSAPPEVVMTERMIPGPAGAPEVRVLVYAPLEAGEARPGILHVHGGGYVIGAPEMSIPGNSGYVTELGAVVVSVDYRLAPETPFPGPVEDCYAGLMWLYANAKDLGVDPARIAISGESAGGGLAAATTLLARDRKEAPVAFQHLIFPMLDDRTASTVQPHVYAGQFVWTPSANVYGWTSLLGSEPGGAGVSPYAAPARAEDLSGLPPTFISCGALDLFIDEDIDYAKRLIAAGVPTELHIYPGAPHAFMFVETAQVTRQHARDSIEALRRGLKPR
jgi:acetyl esterase/lipase